MNFIARVTSHEKYTTGKNVGKAGGSVLESPPLYQFQNFLPEMCWIGVECAPEGWIQRLVFLLRVLV